MINVGTRKYNVMYSKCNNDCIYRKLNMLMDPKNYTFYFLLTHDIRYSSWHCATI